MTEDRRISIANAIRGKGAQRPCHRCDRAEFEVIGEAMISLSDWPGAAPIGGGVAVPVVVVACTNCGCITQHATGVLDVLSSPMASPPHAG